MASVLALAAAVVCRFCRKPALAHALWLLVLLKLIVPPLWKVPVSDSLSRLFPQSSDPPLVHVVVHPMPESETAARARPLVVGETAPAHVKPLDPAVLADRQGAHEPSDASIHPRFASAEAAPLIDPPAGPLQTQAEIWRPAPTIQPWRPALPSMTAAVIGFWLGGSCLCTFIILARLIRFRRLLAYAVPVTHSVQRRADSLARRMGTSTLPSVWFIPGSVCPMLYALGRKPRLLIPEALWDRLDDNQQSSLLVHELAHLRRGDHRVRVLELLVTILYWWNPVAWWARRELREAEEQCCDAWVVWLMPGSARHYASALLEAVEFVSQQHHGGSRNIRPHPSVPLLASGMGEFYRLRRRLIMIKTMRVTRKLTGLGVTSMVALAGLLLPLAPTWAQQPTPEAKPYGIETVAIDPAAGPRAEERAVIEQLRAQSAALQEQAKAMAQQAQVAARQAQEAASQSGFGGGGGMMRRDGKPADGDPRQHIDQELQQARAEVQKLSAALGQATARLKMLEAKMNSGGAGGSAGFGGMMGSGFGGPTLKGGMGTGASVVETPYGRVTVGTATPPSVNFTPGGGGGSMNIAVPPGTTTVRMTPDGKIIETFSGKMNMPSSVEQRLSNLDAQLQMLRDEVQRIRKEMHSSQPNGQRSEGNSSDFNPTVAQKK